MQMTTTDTPSFGRRFLTSRWSLLVIAMLVIAITVSMGPATARADWPTYRHDNARSGMTDQQPDLPLTLRWVYAARHAPKPAWPPPAKQDFWHNKKDLPALCTYDRAYHVVAADGRVYFGTSADDQLVCLDGTTGRPQWTFFAEGPIRVAPALADGRVYFGSDDGHAYCLSAADGRLVWKHRAAGTDRRIAGNGRLISARPLRSGVMIDGPIARLTAGVFPTHGVFHVTLDAATGKPISREPIKISPQGYMQLKGDQVLAETGRRPLVAFAKTQRPVKAPAALGRQPADYPFAFIGGGDLRFVGGDGRVAALEPGKAQPVWTAPVEGRAHSLAVAGGCLLVGTDRGRIYCFGPATKDGARTKSPVGRRPEPFPDGPEDVNRRYASAAQRILAQTKITAGYCLVLNARQGRLAYELARRSKLQVIGLEDDAENVALARERLDRAGLYGRVVMHRGPTDRLPYSDWLFDLVVCDRMLIDGSPPSTPVKEVARVLVPGSGVAYLGTPGREKLEAWRAEAASTSWKIDRDDELGARLSVAEPEGAGQWTHTYADPANTTCSGDRRVSDQLTLQWFGRPGPRNLIDRHHRTFPPLYKSGKVFVPGNNWLFAVSAYNGTVLWEREVPNSRRVAAAGNSGHMAVTDDTLYVVSHGPEKGQCLALDTRTGKQIASLAVPRSADGKPRHWGYVATVGDRLFGSATAPGALRTGHSRGTISGVYYDSVPVVTSQALFCLDRKSGRLRWNYDRAVGAIVNTTISIGGGRIYFVESDNKKTLAAPDGRSKLSDLFAGGSRLVALDALTGAVAWNKPIELQALEHHVYASYADEIVIVAGSRNKDRKVWNDLHAVSAKTGDALWRKSIANGRGAGGSHGEQDQRPVIVGPTVYLEPFAWDLATGRQVEKWRLNRQGHGCGMVSASTSAIYFRAGNPTALQLESGKKTKVTTVSRPGCWINILPAGGMLLIPEASSGCTCGYPVQGSLGFRSVEK